jgi:uncharacterized protein
MPSVIKVLSIDGGGIRGIIPAMVLGEIEDRTGKPASELFDLIAGTSTGGILALGLAKPAVGSNKPQYKAEELAELYEKEGGRIFSRSVWHRTRALGSTLEEKYPSEGIEGVLDEYFGETRLQDALTSVLVTAYEIERRIPWFFRSEKAKERIDYDFPMKQVARATSAAPTYFEPVKIGAEGSSDYYALIDGGVFANNPALCAYVEARGYLEMEGSPYPPDADLLLVSLGTGELTRTLPYEEAKEWGLVRWAQPILSVVFDGVSDTVDHQMSELLRRRKKDGTRRYWRFQRRLDEGNDDMDDAGRTNVRVLKLLAESIVREDDAALSDLCARLVE